MDRVPRRSGVPGRGSISTTRTPPNLTVAVPSTSVDQLLFPLLREHLLLLATRIEGEGGITKYGMLLAYMGNLGRASYRGAYHGIEDLVLERSALGKAEHEAVELE